MRIISGSLKGRRFNPPISKWPTRPTTDIAKEGLFNILHNRFDFDAIRFLDLFGGTGSISFEMISRGCQDVTYLDKYVPALKYVQKLSSELGISSSLTIKKADIFRFLAANANQSYDLIFADPPYDHPKLALLPNLIIENNHLDSGGTLIIEHDHRHNFEEVSHCIERRNYGESIFSFFELS